MSNTWIWVPNISLGPVTIGSRIDTYINQLGFTYDELSDPNDEWVSYTNRVGDIRIDTENQLVVSITSYRDFNYKNLNLIGSTILELGALLGQVADEAGTTVEFDDGDVKSCYDYFDLGLQVWASRGIITSATCITYKD